MFGTFQISTPDQYIQAERNRRIRESMKYKILDAHIQATLSILPSCDVFDSRENRDWNNYDMLDPYEQLILRKKELELQLNTTIDRYIVQNKHLLPDGILKKFQRLHYEQRKHGSR